MRVEVFHSIPPQASAIRQKVFIEEQGFAREFDEIDLTAVHFLLYDDMKQPIATCRVFPDANQSTYFLGRLAVMKEFRGTNMGAFIVRKAEEYVKENGGSEIQLHAQCRVQGFYEKIGYSAFGSVEDEEGCPHIWMKKSLSL